MARLAFEHLIEFGGGALLQLQLSVTGMAQFAKARFIQNRQCRLSRVRQDLRIQRTARPESRNLDSRACRK